MKVENGACLKDKIVILEAELEKTGSEMQRTLELLSISELENKEQTKLVAHQRESIKELNGILKTTSKAHGGFKRKLNEITSSLLPSFDSTTAVGESDNLVDQVTQSLQFLSEVAKAKTGAVDLVRERMKKEILEYKTKASVAAHKEEVLQEGLTISESNANRERELHEGIIAEIERKHERQLSEFVITNEKTEEIVRQLANEVQVSGLEIDNHRQTIDEQRELIKKCEERLKKESSARSYLQKSLADEKRERDIQNRLVKELKMMLKLCGGVGKDFCFEQEDLMLMVNKLSDDQGMLEVENCSLRERVSQSFLVTQEDEEQEVNQQQYQVEVIINESADDIALTEAILAQNLKSQDKN